MSPHPGAPVRVVARKWPDRPHWEYDATVLGADEHGTWLGAPRGTDFRRPGAAFTSNQDQVTLVPDGQGFLAAFFAPGGTAHCDVYVDVTTVPRWGTGAVEAVDLDLDVVRGWSGRVWVDDEDEFARHRVEHAYPEHVVTQAVSTCEQVHRRLAARHPPYDETARVWFARLTQRSSTGGPR